MYPAQTHRGGWNRRGSRNRLQADWLRTGDISRCPLAIHDPADNCCRGRSQTQTDPCSADAGRTGGRLVGEPGTTLACRAPGNRWAHMRTAPPIRPRRSLDWPPHSRVRPDRGRNAAETSGHGCDSSRSILDRACSDQGPIRRLGVEVAPRQVHVGSLQSPSLGDELGNTGHDGAAACACHPPRRLQVGAPGKNRKSAAEFAHCKSSHAPS